MTTTLMPRITYGPKMVACTICGKHLDGDRYGGPKPEPHSRIRPAPKFTMHQIVRAGGSLNHGDTVDEDSIESWLINKSESAEV